MIRKAVLTTIEKKREATHVFYKNLLRARSSWFFLQSLPIIQTQKIVARSFSTYKIGAEELRALKNSIDELFDRDAKNFANGIYSPNLLMPESPLQHSKRYINIFTDNLFVSWRKRKKKNKIFSKQVRASLADLPHYYRRNFHFQTDGYLSEDSADFYDHQVEILFKGTASPMRRMLVAMAKKYLKPNQHDFLELGSGTGSATEFFATSIPSARITCLELSDTYLKRAQKRLRRFHNMNFIKGRAEKTPFKDESFDLVYSVFLFHELPADVRQEVIDEAKRLLRPGGYFLFLDSLQLGDNSELDWALLDFPKNFHEPFYKDYISRPMEECISQSGLKVIDSQIAFLSKAICAIKE